MRSSASRSSRRHHMPLTGKIGVDAEWKAGSAMEVAHAWGIPSRRPRLTICRGPDRARRARAEASSWRVAVAASLAGRTRDQVLAAPVVRGSESARNSRRMTTRRAIAPIRCGASSATIALSAWSGTMSTTASGLPQDLKDAPRRAPPEQAQDNRARFILEAECRETDQEELRPVQDVGRTGASIGDCSPPSKAVPWSEMRRYLERRLAGKKVARPKARALVR